MGSALTIALVLALPIGVHQALRRGGLADRGGTGVLLVLYSMPTYWLGLLLVAGLAIGVHLFPSEAPQATSLAGILADPRALVLPVSTLVLVDLALFSRYMRSSVVDTLAAEYVRTARAKGLSQRLVVWRHVVRNSLGPVVTLVGLSLPAVLTDGLVVELVFNFPGVGLTYYNAAVSSDYPVELGITVIVGVVTVLGSLVADVAYALLDPRIQYS
jgi:peptide/nickel transport system permease protein